MQNMWKGILLAVAVMEAAVVSAYAGDAHNPNNFPYTQCEKPATAYSLAPTMRRPDANTFCFTVQVAVPDGCNSYCCTQADLRKILIDINPECYVRNPRLTATVNGVPTVVGAALEPGLNGNGTFLLRLTQLDLNTTTAQGAEICVGLGPNNAGQGCSTVEELCKPPAGAPAGTCAAALFDSQFNCCHISPIPQAPVTLAPAPEPCKVCATAELYVSGRLYFNVSFTTQQCRDWADMVSAETAEAAAALGAEFVDEAAEVDCRSERLRVCGRLASKESAAPLQDWINGALASWYARLINPCKAYYRSGVATGAYVDNGEGDSGCLNARTSIVCDPPFFDEFPKCKCETLRGATPFFAQPYLDSLPGRTSTTRLYCFNLITQEPYNPQSACGRTTKLLKAEVFADDTKRRHLRGLAFRPATTTTYRFASPTWGSLGDNTLKFTPLNWSLMEAHGASLCMELDSGFDVGEFCFSGSSQNCKINFFDESKDCCPVFDASTY